MEVEHGTFSGHCTYAYTAYRPKQIRNTIIMFHGFTGTKNTWNPLANQLKKKDHLLLIDLPGHGQTIGNEAITMDLFAADIAHFMEEKKLGKAIFLGYSLGGRTALSFAQYYPEKVQALILESASAGLQTEEERQLRVKSDEQLANKLLEDGIETFVDFWQDIPLFDSQKRLNERTKQAIREERMNQQEMGLAQSLRHMGTGKQPSWWDQLSNLTVPVLFITGSLDKKFVALNEQMAEQTQEGKHIIVPDAGHAVHIEKPAYFTQVVEQFL